MDTDCVACAHLANTAQVLQKPREWKPILESVCSLEKDKEFVDKCKRTVGKYLDAIVNEHPRKLCRDIELADVSADRQSLRLGQGEKTVCEYLAGYAKSVNGPSKWMPPLTEICMFIDDSYECQYTLATYLSDIQNKSPQDACAQVNLFDF